MKKIMPIIRRIVNKMLKGQELTTEEALLNNKVGRILMVISGICWATGFSIGLGMAMFEYIKGISAFSNIIFNLISVIFEVALHFGFYNKANKDYKRLKEKQKLEEVSEKIKGIIKGEEKEIKVTISKFLDQLKKPEILK